MANHGVELRCQVGKHTGDLEDAPHLNFRGDYQWADLVPRYYSVPTIWADSTLAALRDLGREDFVNQFNVPYLAATCLWMHPHYRKIIVRDLYRALHFSRRNTLVGTFQLALAFFTGPLRLLTKRILNRLRIILFGEYYTKFDKIDNMVEATDSLLRHLEETGRSFSGCIAASDGGDRK